MAAAEPSIEATSWRGVALAREERVVRDYHASESEVGGLRGFVMSLLGEGERERGDRYLVVTTKRLILVSETELRGGRGRLVKEVQIDRVGGLSGSTASGWMAGWALLRLIGQALIGLILIIALSRLTAIFWVLALALILWFISALAAQGRRVSLHIYARDAQSSPVSIASQAKSGRFSGRYEAFELPATPGRDADRLTQELGALVLDIQADVEAAVERWHSLKLIEAMTKAGIAVSHHPVPLPLSKAAVDTV